MQDDDFSRSLTELPELTEYCDSVAVEAGAQRAYALGVRARVCAVKMAELEKSEFGRAVKKVLTQARHEELNNERLEIQDTLDLHAAAAHACAAEAIAVAAHAKHDHEAAKKAADSAEAAAIAAEAAFISAEAARVAVTAHALDAIALRRRFSSKLGLAGFPGATEASAAKANDKEAADRQREQDGWNLAHGDSQDERDLAELAHAIAYPKRDGGWADSDGEPIDSQAQIIALAKAVALRQIVRDGGHYAPRFHGGTGPSDADGGACGGSGGGVSGV
jgi:hypothetical protein